MTKQKKMTNNETTFLLKKEVENEESRGYF
jgi:hypothetical protein